MGQREGGDTQGKIGARLMRCTSLVRPGLRDTLRYKNEMDA